MREGVFSMTSYFPDSLDNCYSPTDPFPDCAVCGVGYARGLGNLCLKCSHERYGAVIAVAVVIFVVVVMVIIDGIRSLTHPSVADNLPLRRTLSAVVSRFKGSRVYQALKIMVVSWQIVTQASAVVDNFLQNSCSGAFLTTVTFPKTLTIAKIKPDLREFTRPPCIFI